MRKRILHWLPVCGVALLLFGNVAPCCGETPHRASKKRWIASTVALAAANLLDLHSSRGLYEANLLLRSPQGRFSFGRGFAIKSAASGGLVAVELVWLRKNPERDRYRSFAIANTAAAGVTSAIALRNYGLPRPR